MPRPRRSWVWEHCIRSEDGLQATCKLCNGVLQIGGSTSPLNKHLICVHGFSAFQGDHSEVLPKRRRIDAPDADNSMEVENPVQSDHTTTQMNSTSHNQEEGGEKPGESSVGCATETATVSGTNELMVQSRRPNFRVINESSTNSAERTEASSEPGNLTIHNRSSRTVQSGRGCIRSVAGGNNPDRPCNRDRVELITRELTKMVAVNMMPLSFVSSSGFRNFMGILEPNYRVPCVKTIKSRLSFWYNLISEKISAEISDISDVAWTSDCWTSRSQDSYLTVTIHLLDRTWIPKSFTLSTEELSERHTATNLAARLQSVMAGWNLVGKVSAIVTDNAQNVQNAIRELDNLVIDTGVTCAAHTLQLCINNALKIALGNVVCAKASKVVGHFRHSNVATAALERKQEQVGLVKQKLMQSCSTRWNSTYEMIGRLLENRVPVTNVLADRTITTPATAERLEISEREWSTMERLHEVLKPLQIATTVLCGDHALTSLVRPVIYSLRDNHFCESDLDDEFVQQLKETLRGELTSRFNLTYDPIIGVNARQIASFLDPRYKDLLVESSTAREDIRSTVQGFIADDTLAQDNERSSETAMDFLFKTVSNGNSADAQFEMYVSEPQINHNLNPFEWWAIREKRYPALGKLARKYLCIPATSACSERVFSTAGNVVSMKRSCLLPENVNLLVFLYQNRKLMS